LRDEENGKGKMVRVKEEVICLYGMVVGMDDYDIVLRV
jgi:hypothetical protein